MASGGHFHRTTTLAHGGEQVKLQRREDGTALLKTSDVFVEIIGENSGSFPGAARRDHLVAVAQDLRPENPSVAARQAFDGGALLEMRANNCYTGFIASHSGPTLLDLTARPIFGGEHDLVPASFPKRHRLSRSEAGIYFAAWLLSFFSGGTVYMFHDSTNHAWNAITKNVAKYSYGLYLPHVPALWLVFRVPGITGPILGAVTWLAMVAFASFVVFHTIEDPLIRYGKRCPRKMASTLTSRRAEALSA